MRNLKSIQARNHFSDAILNWYDGNARDLPWRTKQYGDCSQKKLDPYYNTFLKTYEIYY